MKEILQKYLIEQAPSAKEEEIEEILSIFEPREFKKGDYFKKPYTSAAELCFMAKGALREFVYNKKGEEVTAKVHVENSFITDLFRLESKNISPIGFECLEDQTLLVASMDYFDKLLETNLTLNIVGRKFLSKKIIEIGKQQLLFVNGSAKDRYDYIIKEYPNLLEKFPLKFIASMIGITPTQLSRVRNKK